MSLKLYRRHKPRCIGSYAEGSFSGEYDERRRGKKRCFCPIHVSGTLDGNFNRKQTGKSEWDEAKVVAAVWESANS
jgi:hypothetical protein